MNPCCARAGGTTKEERKNLGGSKTGPKRWGHPSCDTPRAVLRLAKPLPDSALSAGTNALLRIGANRSA